MSNDNVLGVINATNDAMRIRLRGFISDEVAQTITDEQLDEALDVGRKILISQLEKEILAHASDFIEGMYNPLTGERLSE